MLETTESVKERNVRESLANWFKADKWNYRDLRFWIKGYKFLSGDSDPFVMILKSLFSYPDLKNELSLRIATFLEKEKPYQKSRMTDDDDDVLFSNLFYLAAGLNYRQELGEQFLKIYNYFQKHTEERKEFFSEKKWHNLNNAFREALICNQIDQTFKEVWKAGIRNEQISYIVGDHFSNFRGVAYLPSAENSQTPDVQTIGWALKQMTFYLEYKSKRGEKFRGLIKRTQEVWSDYSNWKEVLINQAKEQKLPIWATQAVSEIYDFPLTKINNSENEFIVVRDISAYLNNQNIEYECVPIGNLFRKIKLDNPNLELIKVTEEKVAEHSKNSLSSTYNGFLGELSQDFFDLANDYQHKNEISTTFLNIGNTLLFFIEPNAEKALSASR